MISKTNKTKIRKFLKGTYTPRENDIWFYVSKTLECNLHISTMESSERGAYLYPVNKERTTDWTRPKRINLNK